MARPFAPGRGDASPVLGAAKLPQVPLDLLDSRPALYFLECVSLSVKSPKYLIETSKSKKRRTQATLVQVVRLSGQLRDSVSIKELKETSAPEPKITAAAKRCLTN